MSLFHQNRNRYSCFSYLKRGYMEKEIIVEFLLQIFSFLGYFTLHSRSTSNICIPICDSFRTKQRCLEIQSIVIVVISKITAPRKILTIGRKHSKEDSGHSFFSNSRLFYNHSYYIFIALLFCNPKSHYSGLCAIITLVLFSHSCIFSTIASITIHKLVLQIHSFR